MDKKNTEKGRIQYPHIRDRIRYIMEYHGLNNTTFARQIGLSTSVTVGHILNGRSNPSFDVIHKITKTYPKINSQWLITGQGTPHLTASRTAEGNAGEGNQEVRDQLEEAKKRIIQLEEKLTRANDLLLKKEEQMSQLWDQFLQSQKGKISS